MTVFQLDHRVVFPPPEMADDNGLLAVGGDLSPERLLQAYAQGIFPWYDEGLPILWHSPNPRMVLRTNELYINRSLRKALNKNPYRLSMDTAFEEVIRACAKVPRAGQSGTWITDDMIDAYCELHRRGYAHSAEAWRGSQLVGGFYGVSLGSAFFGESMFALASDASKIAFVAAVQAFASWGISMIDCQVHTDHLEHFGAREWPRSQFLRALKDCVAKPTQLGPWQLPEGKA